MNRTIYFSERQWYFVPELTAKFCTRIYRAQRGNAIILSLGEVQIWKSKINGTILNMLLVFNRSSALL